MYWYFLPLNIESLWILSVQLMEMSKHNPSPKKLKFVPLSWTSIQFSSQNLRTVSPQFPYQSLLKSIYRSGSNGIL